MTKILSGKVENGTKQIVYMSSRVVLMMAPGGCFPDKEPETERDQKTCQEQEDIYSWSQRRCQNFHVRGSEVAIELE